MNDLDPRVATDENEDDDRSSISAGCALFLDKAAAYFRQRAARSDEDAEVQACAQNAANCELAANHIREQERLITRMRKLLEDRDAQIDGLARGRDGS